MGWYKTFEECGHINYEIKERKDENFNLIDNTIKQSNNIYSWHKNDIREDWKFRKDSFHNVKTTNISEIEKNMVVLDSGATNGV